MKHKIFYFSTSLNIGGTERNLLTLADNLKNDYDISVGFIKDRGFIGDILEKKGFEVNRFSSMLSLYGHLKEKNFDIMETFLFRANIIGRVIGKLACVPVVISTQQAIDDWKKPYHVWLEAFTSKWCGLIVANSNTAKNVLVTREKIDPAKIEVVYNGIDFDKFKPKRLRQEIRRELNIGQDDNVVVYVGRLHKEKGADFLPLITKNVENAVVVALGDGPERASIEKSAKALGVDGRLKIAGWRHDIADILAASDIFILPSREESFPQVILEAMSCSLPVVASDVGGVRELVEDGVNGIVVKALDTQALSQSVKTLLADKNTAKQYGISGYKKSQNFPESKMVGSFGLIYQKLIKQHENK